jgi:hypothetical protein
MLPVTLDSNTSGVANDEGDLSPIHVVLGKEVELA